MTMKLKSKKLRKRPVAAKPTRRVSPQAKKRVPAAPKERSVPAGQFKAKCLSMLDEVAAGRELIVVTKRGKAVARVCPIDWFPVPDLQGTVIFHGDIVTPDDEPRDGETQ